VRVPFLTLSAAVAVTDAIRRCTGIHTLVKWPNDVLIGQKKVCGILAELSTEADRINHAVLGIDVNVNHDPEELPASIGATSLKIAGGAHVCRLTLLRSLIEEIEKCYEQLTGGRFEAIAQQWLTTSATVGKRVTARSLSGRTWTGVATGLDNDGCLLLRLDNGLTQRITGGDVTVMEHKPPARSLSE
jgi:BirA family biotin operon repressor/biotin-[acetyl-CoA-carboxylase] ligase